MNSEEKRMRKNTHRKVPIENVETGEVYAGIIDACEKLPCSYNAMCVALHKGGKCRGYHWKYVGKEAVIKEYKASNWKGVPVIDMDTKEEWVSITACAKAFNMEAPEVLSSVHRHFTINGRYIALKEQYEKYGIDLKLIYKTERPKNILNRLRQVQCVETGEVFENSTVCAAKLQCSRQAVSAAIRDGFAVRGKHLVMFGDTFEPSKLTGGRGRKTYPVIDIASGKRWASVEDCAKSYGVNTSKVRYYIKIDKPMADGALLTFERDKPIES